MTWREQWGRTRVKREERPLPLFRVSSRDRSTGRGLYSILSVSIYARRAQTSTRSHLSYIHTCMVIYIIYIYILLNTRIYILFDTREKHIRLTIFHVPFFWRDTLTRETKTTLYSVRRRDIVNIIAHDLFIARLLDPSPPPALPPFTKSIFLVSTDLEALLPFDLHPPPLSPPPIHIEIDRRWRVVLFHWLCTVPSFVS